MAKELQRDSDLFERQFIYDYDKVYNDNKENKINPRQQPSLHHF